MPRRRRRAARQSLAERRGQRAGRGAWRQPLGAWHRLVPSHPTSGGDPPPIEGLSSDRASGSGGVGPFCRLGRQAPQAAWPSGNASSSKEKKSLRRRDARREHRVVIGSSWYAWSPATSRSQAIRRSPEVCRRPGQRSHDGERGVLRRPARRQAVAQRVELALDLGPIEARAPNEPRAAGSGSPPTLGSPPRSTSTAVRPGLRECFYFKRRKSPEKVPRRGHRV
jgi:hypothetical protein